MNNNNWKNVFCFTVSQVVKGKNFMALSIGTALLLFAGLFGINVFVASIDKKNEDKSDAIQKVYYSGSQELPQVEDEFFQSVSEQTNITFEEVKEEEFDVDSINTKDENAIYVKGSIGEDGAWKLDIVYGEDSNVDTDMCEKFSEDCEVYIKQIKMGTLNLSQEQILLFNTPVLYDILEAGGNERSIGETMFKMFAPMIVCFVMYMMVIIYGQSITKVVIAEKTSKLMETMLTTAKPYDIIAGKILGMVCVALVQMSVWVGCGVGGFFLGDKVARGISDSYHNVIIDIGKVIQESSKDAFSVSTILCAVLAFCLGFIFFSVIAGWAASRLEKVEDLSGAITVFQVPVIISFLAAYMIPLQENAFLSRIIRFIPFTGAFCLPADCLIGSAKLWEGIIGIGILLAAIIVMIYITGKSYKKNVF